MPQTTPDSQADNSGPMPCYEATRNATHLLLGGIPGFSPHSPWVVTLVPSSIIPLGLASEMPPYLMVLFSPEGFLTLENRLQEAEPQDAGLGGPLSLLIIGSAEEVTLDEACRLALGGMSRMTDMTQGWEAEEASVQVIERVAGEQYWLLPG